MYNIVHSISCELSAAYNIAKLSACIVAICEILKYCGKFYFVYKQKLTLVRFYHSL